MKYRNEQRYHTRRLVEIELRNFNENKLELEEKREQLMNGSSFQDVCVQSGSTGNPTLSKVISLCDIAFMESERKIKAIEDAMKQLECQPDKDYHRIITMKYFDKKLTDLGIMEKLHLSKSNYWRKHHKSVS